MRSAKSTLMNTYTLWNPAAKQKTNNLYLCNRHWKYTLKTTEKASGTAQFVAANDEINGYKAVVSPQLTANNYVFGNFNDLLVGMFGGLDIVVDPFTGSSAGNVRIVALQSVDVAVRHAVSFCAAS